MRKAVAAILMIIFLMQPMAESTFAQSTKPSAPKFTIQFSNDDTIQIVIQNQAFTSSSSVNSLIYYNRVKDHYSDRWIIDKNYQLQSGSKTTSIEIDLVPLGYFVILNNSSILDFQVQAVTGYYLITQKPGHMPGALINFTSPDGYSEITFNDSETSAWSNTVTVDLKEKIMLSPSQISSLTTTSPIPTATPYPPPNRNAPHLDSTFYLLPISIILAIIIAVFVIYRRRKVSK
jgi:hypothetical protein